MAITEKYRELKVAVVAHAHLGELLTGAQRIENVDDRREVQHAVAELERF